MKSNCTAFFLVLIFGVLTSCKEIKKKENVMARGTFRIFQNRSTGIVELDTGTLFLQISPAYNPLISGVTFDIDGVDIKDYWLVCSFTKDRNGVHCSTDTSLLADVNREHEFLNHNAYTMSISLDDHIDVEKVKTVGIVIASRHGKEKVSVRVAVRDSVYNNSVEVN